MRASQRSSPRFMVKVSMPALSVYAVPDPRGWMVFSEKYSSHPPSPTCAGSRASDNNTTQQIAFMESPFCLGYKPILIGWPGDFPKIIVRTEENAASRAGIIHLDNKGFRGARSS